MLTREVLGGFNQFGNANLRRSLIQNFDAKWEWYPDAGEVVSFGVFGKRFDDPVVGPRITTAGVSPLPDVEDQPRHVVDLSLRFPIFRDLTGRVDARNLFDAAYVQRQGSVTIERFQVGRTLSAGLSWRP